MSENGEIYTTGKNFTLPPAATGWTNFTSVNNFLDHLWMGTSSLRDEIRFHYDYERALIMGMRALMMGYFTLLRHFWTNTATMLAVLL